MFQRAAFLGQVRLADPFRRPPVRRLGGMLEDYQNEINALKDKLSKLQKPYMQPQPRPSAFPFSSELPPSVPPAPPYQPPQGQLGCYIRPNGSAYWGYPDGISKFENVTEFQCEGIANAKPLEPPPEPPTTTEIDLPGPGMPPIAVRTESEEEGPVNVRQPFPGEHPPVSTGIKYGEEAQPPYHYWPPPIEQELAICPKGIFKAAPGVPCPYGTSRTIPGSDCCYPDVQSVPQYGSWYPPTTTPTTINPFESGYNTSSFQGLPFSGGSDVSAASLTGRRRYPVVNLRPRRW